MAASASANWQLAPRAPCPRWRAGQWRRGKIRPEVPSTQSVSSTIERRRGRHRRAEERIGMRGNEIGHVDIITDAGAVWRGITRPDISTIPARALSRRERSCADLWSNQAESGLRRCALPATHYRRRNRNVAKKNPVSIPTKGAGIYTFNPARICLCKRSLASGPDLLAQHGITDDK
jgi:hypothetical protein